MLENIEDHINPKLRNINLHNITHSLVSRNPRERMFIVQTSLLIVTFLSLLSRISSLMQTTKKANPHSHITPCVNMSRVSPPYSYSSSSATCWMLVHAYATSPGKTKWSGPHQRRWEENEFNFYSVTCYTTSIVSRIHINIAKLPVISRALWLSHVWYNGV